MDTWERKGRKARKDDILFALLSGFMRSTIARRTLLAEAIRSMEPPRRLGQAAGRA
jgi:hypothetical protein